jgi:hypothetical protein
MGMFDSIICLRELPLSEELKKLNKNWRDADFQTKDLDNSLSLYRIEESGDLIREIVEYDYEEYTAEELKTIKPKPWNLYKKVTVNAKYDEHVNHHGKILFYTSVEFSEEKDIWVDFEATYTHGKLDGIVLVDQREVTSQKANNKYWEEFTKEQAKLPWNRFKNFAGSYGWYWFWRKVYRLTTFTARTLDTLANKIQKHLL